MMVFVLRSSLISSEDDDCLYFEIKIALKIMRPWALTYHQGSVTNALRAPNFSSTIYLFATTMSLKSRARILAP